MTAVSELIDMAEAAGVHLHLDGEKVRMTAEAPPPASLLEVLRQNRDAIAAALQRGADNGATVETPGPHWLSAYEERVCIAMEGGADEDSAHAIAWNESIVVWLRHHPIPEPKAGCCARCGFPVSGPDTGAYWYRDGDETEPLPVHGKCVQLLQWERRREAEKALRAAGIRP